jgi:hypothetical protein
LRSAATTSSIDQSWRSELAKSFSIAGRMVLGRAMAPEY